MSPESGIDAVRRALGLSDADEATVHEAGARLEREVEGWVDAFHARLRADPAAAALVRDEATALRIRRSLAAWFQEMLSLPYDAAYERARTEIGRVHLRTGMPQHLMVTAMSGVRRDVRASVARAWADDPAKAARVGDAVEKVLDLELALMLDAYRRRSRELAHRTDRSLLARRAETRAARERADAADAAACWLSLLRRAREPEGGERWASSLARALEAVARPAPRPVPEAAGPSEPARPASIADVCAGALDQVSAPPRTEIEVIVAPPDATVIVHEAALRLAVEELLQVAVNRDPGGAVRLAATALADGGLWIEVSHGGPRWAEGARSVEEALSAEGAHSVAFSELVAEAHGGALELVRPPGRGGGLRLRLPALAAEALVP